MTLPQPSTPGAPPKSSQRTLRRAVFEAFPPATRLVEFVRRGVLRRQTLQEITTLAQQNLTGLMIVLEGLDGSGKTTQAAHLARALKTRGNQVSLYKEPGDTPTGRYLQKHLRDGGPQHPVAAAGLFVAAHAELMHTSILPDLANGRTVIMDRFTPSCLAYQCHRDLVPEEPILRLHHHTYPFPLPAHYIFLDLHPETSIERSAARDDSSRDPNEVADYRARVLTRKGYLSLIHRDPTNWHIIDANETWEIVSQRILAHAISVINTHRATPPEPKT